MIFVDTAKNAFRNMIMSHMMADTTDELIELAENIGLRSRWIQAKGTWKEHFDVSQSKRCLAIKRGAIVLNPRSLAYLMKLSKKESFSEMEKKHMLINLKDDFSRSSYPMKFGHIGC